MNPSIIASIREEPEVPALKVVEDHIKEFTKGIYKVTTGVYVAIGYAIANSICVETKNSLVIIDVLEDVTAARIVCKEFKQLTNNKPIKAIIFTHSHADHTAGIYGFTENESPPPVIYAHKNCASHIKRKMIFSYGDFPRGCRQFGTILNNELPLRDQKKWFKNAGIGSQLNIGCILDPNDVTRILHQYEYSSPNWNTTDNSNNNPTNNKLNIITFENNMKFKIDEQEFILEEQFGETNDQILIYNPQHSILMPGDNIYKAFPNLYAIRGVYERNTFIWYKSIELNIKYVEKHNIRYLIPSHSKFISNTRNILHTLNVYRDGIAFVHNQTLRLLNQGFIADEIIKIIKEYIDGHMEFLFTHPYLLEHYGTVEWSVRGIIVRNQGWFSGRSEDLFPPSKYMRGQGIQSFMKYLMNRNTSVMDSYAIALDYCKYEMNKHFDGKEHKCNERNRWILEFVTCLQTAMKSKEMNLEQKRMNNELNEIRFGIMRDIASKQISSPARNYLLQYWFEQKYDIEHRSKQKIEQYIKNLPLQWIVQSFAFLVHPKRTVSFLNGMNKYSICGLIKFNDIGIYVCMKLKWFGVMQITLFGAKDVNEQMMIDMEKEADWIFNTKQSILQFIIISVRSPGSTMSHIEADAGFGHYIPRIRSLPCGLAAILFAMVSSERWKRNGWSKSREKAIVFFKCLEMKTISKL